VLSDGEPSAGLAVPFSAAKFRNANLRKIKKVSNEMRLNSDMAENVTYKKYV